MNILIIDDEPKIRNGLEKIIGKMNPDWIVTDTAPDAITALEKINGTQPDVLLLDIRMPRMDGLELLERVYSEKKDVIVVVISGHAEFEYAQKAMRYGALDYILKPVSPQRLKEVLENAEQLLNGLKERTSQHAYVENSITEIREKFLHDIIFETNYISKRDAVDKAKFLNLSLGRFCIVTLMIGLRQMTDHNTQNQIKNADLKSVFGDILDHHNGGHILCNGIGSFIIVVKLSTCTNAAVQAQTICDELVSQVSSDIDVTVGLGGIYNEISEAYLSYRESLLTIRGENELLRRDFPAQEASERVSVKLISTRHQGANQYSVIVRQAIDYILKNFDRSNLKIDDIAKSVYVHANYLSVIFKKETGENISDFIADCRTESAKELLLKFENKIYMVAEKVGFKDQRYFSHVFKKKTGMTPAEFREKSFLNTIMQ